MKKKLMALILALVLVSGVMTVLAVSEPKKIVPPGAVTAGVANGDETTWYPDNTVGVAGFSLRELYPELTDKWYNVVPVDLTQDGVQSFRLVASNLYYIGQADVTVQGDEVTVTYELARGNREVKSETLRWFTAWEDITTDYLNDPASSAAFGQTISRKNDLNGQDVALLLICNRVSYRQPYYDDGTSLVRYWATNADWVAYREALQPLLDMVPVTHPAAVAATETDMAAASVTDLAATETDLAATGTDL